MPFFDLDDYALRLALCAALHDFCIITCDSQNEEWR
jgi:hypothetical protein